MLETGKIVATLMISVLGLDSKGSFRQALWLRRSISFASWLAALLLVMSSTLMAFGDHAAMPSFEPIGRKGIP